MWAGETCLLEHDVGIDHEVVLCVRRQLGCCHIAGWVQSRAAGDVIAQIVLPLHLEVACMTSGACMAGKGKLLMLDHAAWGT